MRDHGSMPRSGIDIQVATDAFGRRTVGVRGTLEARNEGAVQQVLLAVFARRPARPVTLDLSALEQAEPDVLAGVVSLVKAHEGTVVLQVEVDLADPPVTEAPADEESEPA